MQTVLGIILVIMLIVLTANGIKKIRLMPRTYNAQQLNRL